MQKNKGVTLTELLAVIIVLGIIMSISIILITNVVYNSRIKADLENVKVLNRSTYYYFLDEGDNNVFIDLENDEERIWFLVDEGYLNKFVSASVRNSEYIWDIESNYWIYTMFDQATEEITEIDFTSFDIDSYENYGNWELNEANLISDYGMIFIDNPRLEYTIIVNAKIEEGSYGGFGILFDTAVIDGSDSGFILQFDRGYGRGSVVIRPREDGDEGNVVQSHRFDYSNSFIPDKNTTEGQIWWNSEHKVELKVLVIEGVTYTKILSVKIDNQLLFNDFSYETSVTSSNNFTGLRTWSGVEVEFYSISIN